MTRMFSYVRISIVELVRLPSFLLPLAVFPTLLYVTIGLQQSGDRSLIVLGYCAFAILGTMMFQFGVGVATSRNEPWSIYVQTLPGRASERLAAMLVSGVAFSAAFCVPVVSSALVLSQITLPPSPAMILIACALVFGAVSLGLLGLALGYWLPARGAVAIANIAYFPLSFAGGLFGPIDDGMLATMHPWIPTGAWMDLLYSAAAGGIAPRSAYRSDRLRHLLRRGSRRGLSPRRTDRVRMTMTPGTPCWWELRANDVVAACTYYARRFGWTYSPVPARSEYCVARDAHGSEVGAIGPKAFGLTRSTAWATFLHSPVLGDTLALTVRNGGRVLTPPIELGELGAFAVISDVVGATVGLWQGQTVPGVMPSHGSGPARIATSELITPDPSASESFYAHVFGAKPTVIRSPRAGSYWSPLFARGDSATPGDPVGIEGEHIRFLAD